MEKLRTLLNSIKNRQLSAILILVSALLLAAAAVAASFLAGRTDEKNNTAGQEPVRSSLSSQADAEDGSVKIYFLNKDITAILPVSYTPEAVTSEEKVSELLGQLMKEQDQIEYVSPISGFSLLGHSIRNGMLTLDFSADYHEQPVVREILARAAIVDTLTQVGGILSVSFTVDGAPLLDERGQAVGPMSADSFVFNLGKDINAYEKTRLRLYFADKDGTHLLGINRTVIYNSNISKDKLIVEELLKGPNGEGIYPTINPDTVLLGVTSRDGVCYINFDKSFLTNPYAVSANVSLWSVVNSVTELPDVDRVQISIDGDTSQTYMDSLSLRTVYERDLSLVSK